MIQIGTDAQEPTPCLVPKQFNSNISQYDHGEDRIRRFREVYDAENKRIIVFENPATFIVPGQKLHNYYFLYNKNITYTYNIVTHECTKSTPSSPWREFSIPRDATFENEYTIGGQSEAFLAQEWSDRVPNKSTGRWIGVFTLNKCYPVSEVYIEGYDITHTTTTTFHDTVIGALNPADFIPPKECNDATVSVKPQHAPRLHHLRN
ncbi:hypothetical protein KUTeg_001895 [Tegillarca granosa]|uniref:Mammalian ependymin-related protein 1 n=1 Tax=Tegillarca granosa TaxID=220873 RepID=A0ABQ9FX61_TEGGR|nr:hypothetical protein KUTeg_001895 [Tegillarca granosa]